jgi:hypothetical protein
MTRMRVEAWWRGDGIAWFDDIILLEGRADLNGDGLDDGSDTGPVEEPNLLTNPSFEKDDDNGGEPDTWVGMNQRIYMDYTQSYSGNSSLKLVNDGTVYHYAYQDVPINRKVDGFTLAGWNKLEKHSDVETHGTPHIWGRCYYEDGTYQIFYEGIAFNTETHDWQFGSNYFNTDESKVMTRMRVEAWWRGDGIAWFDDIQLIEIPFQVTIDIKPGSDPNSINLGSEGTVPVAIFSTVTFDATTVDPVTVILASAPVKLRGKGTPMASFEDVNGDGLLDIVVHVETEALQLSETDTEAILDGQTFDGTPIRGVDSVRVVP